MRTVSIEFVKMLLECSGDFVEAAVASTAEAVAALRDWREENQ
jgi:hypothetical protein